MCQQKRLNIGLKHNPGSIGVKRVQAVVTNFVFITGCWNVLWIDRMKRYKMEHQRRRLMARDKQTLIYESLGSNWD